MARGHWQNAKTYNFGGLGGSRVTNMNAWNCDPKRRKPEKLQSFVNVTGIIKEEMVCMPVEEPLPTESSKAKCIPFALKPEFQKPCRYGLGCTRMGCLYQHPTDMPLAEPGKLVDVDVYVSMIERNTTKAFIEEIGRKHGKVLYIAMPKKDPAGNYISKRPDGRFTCNIHFSHAESATNFIKFINNETKIPVLAEMKAMWQNIDEYDHSADSSYKIDWRESLKNKAARLKATAAPQPVRLTPPVQSTPVQSTPTPPPTPPPDEPLITTRVRKVEDAEGFTTIGRNGKAMYELEIEEEQEDDDELCLEENGEEEEEEDDELCLEENSEEKIQEKKKQERSTCGTSSTESSPNTLSTIASRPSSPFTVPGQKLLSWHDLQEKKKNATKEEAFGTRSFLSLFKAVDASDNESDAQALEAQTSEHLPLAQVTVQTVHTDNLAHDDDDDDDDDDESIASIDSAVLSEIDNLEDDFVFAKNAAKRR